MNTTRTTWLLAFALVATVAAEKFTLALLQGLGEANLHFTQEISAATTGDGVTQLVTVRVLPAITTENPVNFVRLRVIAN